MKKLLGVALIIVLTYCSEADKVDEQADIESQRKKEEPCVDSIEKTMYDEHGTAYKVMVPCE